MGWWTEERNGKALMIGDGPLDIAHQMLLRIAKQYKRDDNRNPTPEEMVKTLEIAISAAKDLLFDDLEDKEVSELTIKLKKAPRRQPYAPGDFFSVPLPTGGYGFGRVLDKFISSSILIGLLDVYADAPLALEELKIYPVLFEAVSDSLTLEDWGWRVLGNVPIEGLDPNRTKKQLLDELGLQLSRLQGSCGSAIIPGRLERRLSEGGRIP
jgi:hypothetical protein